MRVKPNAQVVALLREIDRQREQITPVQALSPSERERWLREYAECAAKHSARLDYRTAGRVTG